jgi:hypothetical protein
MAPTIAPSNTSIWTRCVGTGVGSSRTCRAIRVWWSAAALWAAPSALVPLSAYWSSRLSETRGIALIDSLPLRVCQNRRIHSHRVFAGTAARGKSSVDWFFGFQLHFVMNDTGDLRAVRFTPGHVEDRAPVPALTEDLWGKLFGDRGDIRHAWFERLWENGLQLVTKLKRNRKNKLMPLLDQLLLRQRALIESVGEQLKHVCQIEHTRHRSVHNGFVNMIAALVAYTWQERRPSLHLQPEERTLLFTAAT